MLSSHVKGCCTWYLLFLILSLFNFKSHLLLSLIILFTNFLRLSIIRTYQTVNIVASYFLLPFNLLSICNNIKEQWKYHLIINNFFIFLIIKYNHKHKHHKNITIFSRFHNINTLHFKQFFIKLTNLLNVKILNFIQQFSNFKNIINISLSSAEPEDDNTSYLPCSSTKRS